MIKIRKQFLLLLLASALSACTSSESVTHEVIPSVDTDAYGKCFAGKIFRTEDACGQRGTSGSVMVHNSVHRAQLSLT